MARGSHATWGAYDSRVCIICGQPIRITLDAAWMHHDNTTGKATSAHTACGSPLREAPNDDRTDHRSHHRRQRPAHTPVRHRHHQLRRDTTVTETPDTEPVTEPEPEPETDTEPEPEPDDSE